MFYFIFSKDNYKQEIDFFKPFLKMNEENPLHYLYDYFKNTPIDGIYFSLESFRPFLKKNKFGVHFLINFPLKSDYFLNEIGLKINVMKRPLYKNGSPLECFLKGWRDTEVLKNPFESFVIAFRNIVLLKNVPENSLLLFGTVNSKAIERSFLDLCNLTNSNYKMSGNHLNDIKDLSCFGLRFLVYNNFLGMSILFKENKFIPFFTISRKIKIFTPGIRLSYGKEFFGDVFIFANFEKFCSHLRLGIFNYDEIGTLSILFGLGKSFGSLHMALNVLLAQKKGLNLFLDFCLWIFNFRIGYKVKEPIYTDNFSFSAVLY